MDSYIPGEKSHPKQTTLFAAPLNQMQLHIMCYTLLCPANMDDIIYIQQLFRKYVLLFCCFLPGSRHCQRELQGSPITAERKKI